MFPYILAIISFFGFLASLILHIMTFLRFSNVIISIILLLIAFLLAVPGQFIYSAALPPYNRSFQANYNFWRLIPLKGRMILKIVTFYGVGVFIVTVLFFNSSRHGLPDPYNSRVVTVMAMIFYFYHLLGYWYHSPVQVREDLISMLKSRKHLKRHRKHDDVSKI